MKHSGWLIFIPVALFALFAQPAKADAVDDVGKQIQVPATGDRSEFRPQSIHAKHKGVPNEGMLDGERTQNAPLMKNQMCGVFLRTRDELLFEVIGAIEGRQERFFTRGVLHQMSVHPPVVGLLF